MATLGHALHEALGRAPLSTAIEAGDRRISRGLLDRAARIVGSELRSVLAFDAPTRPPRLGILAESSIPTAATLIGALYAGVTLCPLHTSTPLAELRQVAAHLGLDAIAADQARAAVAAETGLPVLRVERLPASDGAPLPPPPADERTAGLLLTTSGTTGKPRAVVVSHRSLRDHTSTLARSVLGLDSRDRVLAMLPIAHSYGCRMALLAPLLGGATVVLSPRYSASGSAALLAEADITFVPVVPTMLAGWIGQPRRALPALRWALSAGAPLPRPLREAAETWLDAEVREGYGLTEASFCTVDAPPGAAGHGTVGRPVPGVEVRVVPRPELGGGAPGVGAVEVRGENVMDGYLDDPAATKAVMTTDGWLGTGDLGRLDDDGRLVLTDREKDIILSGGHTVVPAEVEALLMGHPEIVGAAVVGLPDPFLGERVTAFIVTAANATTVDEMALVSWCHARLASWKVPTAWRFVEALPVGPSGKVLRRALR